MVREKECSVLVSAGRLTLQGDLCLSEGAQGVVAFAHGSGSSRLSPRNRHVARRLRQAGLATLLIDLLTASEEAVDMEQGNFRFDIGLLARRLVGATDTLKQLSDTKDLFHIAFKMTVIYNVAMEVFHGKSSPFFW